MPAFKDLTGQRFGRLTVLSRAEDYISPAGKKTVRWLCRCDCGNEVTVLRSQLTRGTASCGCLQREAAQANATDLTGQRFGRWTVLRRAPLARKEGNGSINGWLCRCDCGTERVVVARALTSGSSASCGCQTREKAADRIRTEGANVLGRYDHTVISKLKATRPTAASTTGVRGVYWSEREQLYKVAVSIRGQSIYIGRYASLEDAKKARQEAEDKYYKPIIDEFDFSK